MASSSSSTSLLMLLYAFMAVLIVDAAQVVVAEDFVGLADFDEALVRGLVVGILVGVVLLGEFAVGFFELPAVGVFVDGEQFVVVFGGEGEEREEAQECEGEAGEHCSLLCAGFICAAGLLEGLSEAWHGMASGLVRLCGVG